MTKLTSFFVQCNKNWQRVEVLHQEGNKEGKREEGGEVGAGGAEVLCKAIKYKRKFKFSNGSKVLTFSAGVII